jgi:hypothetical protein
MNVVPIRKMSQAEDHKVRLKKRMLARLEEEIPNDYVTAGTTFAKIRDSRCLRIVLGYPTFAQYCRFRWNVSPRHVNRIIAAANVAENVRCNGCVPLTERHARLLTSLTPENQRLSWLIAMRSAQGGVVTRQMIIDAINKVATL